MEGLPSRNTKNFRRRKTRTKTIIDKLTYNPKKHNQKTKKKLRQKLQQQPPQVVQSYNPPTSIKFGSFNVNGLDLEVAWAAENLLRTRGFDVSRKLQNLFKLN